MFGRSRVYVGVFVFRVGFFGFVDDKGYFFGLFLSFIFIVF